MDGPFGFLVIDKPQCFTSHDCVNRIRKVFRIKRVGHGGTLDPAVTGVLPIALGQATRLLPYLPSDKKYTGVIQLGKRTTTDDLEGEIISSEDWPRIEQSSLEKHLEQFRGPIQQCPPQVSSVHISGERAYKKARRGEQFDLPARAVTIHEIRILNWNQNTGEIEVNVHCSTGTYIRALARDLGNSLGCGGCLARLHRTQALGFKSEQAIPLPSSSHNDFYDQPSIIEPAIALSHLPRFQITKEEDLVFWRTGRQLTTNANQIQYTSQTQMSAKKVIVVLDLSENVIGIASLHEKNVLQPKVVFNAMG